MQTDLGCILKDHQRTLHPGDHLCLFIPRIQLPHTNIPVFSVNYNSVNGPFGVMLNSGGMPNCPSLHVKDTEKPLSFQRKQEAANRQLNVPFTVGPSSLGDS